MDLFGRRQLFSTTEDITRDNIIPLLNELLSIHTQNMLEMDYLYWYRRGLQPILQRKKEVRPEINNKVTENHAAEIVAFKNGYFLTRPAFYIARKDGVGERVKELNEYLYLSGKQQVDNKITDWFHTVGVGILYVEPSKSPPVKVYCLDPRSAFVVYSRRPGNEPIMGVNIVIQGNGDSAKAVFDVFTKEKLFRVSGGVTSRLLTNTPIVGTAVSVDSEERNVLGEIPMVEYQYENSRMGSFESVIPMLDAINAIQSNRVDGVEQFIQSLLVFYNCQPGEDPEGNPITPAYIREAGAVFLKSIGQDKADLKILAEQLDQGQTQTLIDDIYKQAMMISGVPMANNSGGTSDNVGAVYLRTGWATADTFARNTEDLFKESNRRFDRIFLSILRTKVGLDLSEDDIDLQFTRNEMENLLVKTQGALNLKQLGLSPEIALGRSGVSNDPVGDVANSKPYIDRAWGTQQPVELVEETRDDAL